MIRTKRAVAGASLLSLLVVAAPASAARLTVSPAPGMSTALPRTQISFLGAAPGSLTAVRVIGSRSARHKGRLLRYSSAVGMSFVPHAPFRPGEHVTVRARWKFGRRTRVISTHFKIAQPVAPPLTQSPTNPGSPADVQSFHSLPELHPPAVVVDQAPSQASAPGYLFSTPSLGPGQYGPMIFDDTGRLVWFRALPAGEGAADFRTQDFHGRNELTWWQGRTIALGYGLGEDVIANANYRAVAVVHAGNGLQADGHEFDITPGGTAYVLAYSPVRASLAPAGGPSSGVVLDGVIQKIDIRTGLVMWEWHSLSHVGVSESYSKLPESPAAPYDYFHIDSLDTDSHGNLLVSAANTSTVYDLNARTGAVIWRLGGKRSTYKLAPGAQFAHQHDARWLSGSELSLFDDEAGTPSRGAVLRLDARKRTATLSTELSHTGAPLAASGEGNLQSLPGGRWMVGWGGLANFTEFDGQGRILLDAQLPDGESSYRTYRLPWNGQPSEPPAIAASTSGATTTVYASWNGATTVSSWQLLGGASPAQLTPAATASRTGFETTITVSAEAFFAVRALSASGRVLGISPTITPSGG